MSISYRRFGPADLQDVARVFAASLNDLLQQAGAAPYFDLDDPDAWGRVWERDRRPLFEHLASNQCESWLAEEEGQILGYARSILRDGMCQLTEFFVLPGRRSRGIGRELLSRAFESVSAKEHTVISTTSPAAMARYLKAGV